MAEAIYAAIEAIVEIVGSIGAEQIATFAIELAVSYGITAYNAAQARKKARDAYNSSLEDRAVVIRSSVAERPVIYGETVVGGPIVFIGSEGAKAEQLHIVVALAGHEITDIVDVFFDDASIGPLDSSGAVSSGRFNKGSTTFSSISGVVGGDHRMSTEGISSFQSVVIPGRPNILSPDDFIEGDTPLLLGVDYTIVDGFFVFADAIQIGNHINATYTTSAGAPYVYCFKHLGQAGQVSSALLQQRFPGVWTAQHVGNGVAYAHLLLVFDQDLFPNGVPTIRFLVQGKPVFDPRSGSTAYSSNPALHTRDYLTTTQGFNCDASEINDPLVITAANICDEQVQIAIDINGQPVYHSRYVGAGVVSTADDRKDNLEQIMSAMGPGEAGACYVQGQWNIYAGAYLPPAITLSEKHLTAASPVSVVPRLSRADLYNGVQGTFIDPAQNYQAVDFPQQTNATYEAEDDEQILKDVELPFTDNLIRAQRIAKALVERSRSSCTLTASFKMAAYPTAAFDTIGISLARYGFVNKPFTVIDRTFDPMGGITLALREANPTMWNWSYLGIQLTSPPPPSQLPNPFTVGMLAINQVLSDNSTVQVQDDGTIIPRVFLQWTASNDSNVFFGGYVEVQFIRAGDVTWTAMPFVRGNETSTYIIGPKAGGFYTIRARFVNGLGVSSPDWTYTQLVVSGRTSPPSNVTDASVVPELFGLRVKWGNIPDKDLDSYEVRLGDSWDTGVFVTRDKVTSYLYKVQAAGDYKFWIKAYNTSQVPSQIAGLAEAIITIPAPTNLSGSINGAEMVLGWEAVNGTFAIDHYELRQGASWAAGVPLTSGVTATVTKATSYRQEVQFGGTRMFWVAAVDVAGNVGTPVSTTISIDNPSNVVATASVIDNNVFLRLADSTTTLPITSYVIRKGVSFDAGADVGDNGNGRFAVFFETVSGNYTYWVVAIDTAGNKSVATSVSANVDQPPDYILQADIHSTFTGASTNAISEAGLLYTPLTPETWQHHFESHGGGGGGSTIADAIVFGVGRPFILGSREFDISGGGGGGSGWNTPQDQVDAGYPAYFEPSVPAGSYEEVIDYGAVLPTTTVTATLSSAVIVGAVTAVCTISYKAASGDPWTVGATGATQVVANHFRFARIHYDFNATGAEGHNLLAVSDLEIKLSVKLRNDAGMGTALLSDSGGTFVPFNYPFIDISSITVTPSDSAPCFITYSFVDAPNPTGFFVYAWDKNGNRLTKDFSWSAKGY